MEERARIADDQEVEKADKHLMEGGAMFLADIEKKNQRVRAKYEEIRRIISHAVMPSPREFGIACALRLDEETHRKLEEVRSRHGIHSLREAAFKALALGLATMSRLPASDIEPNTATRRAAPKGRVLTSSEISRLKEEGYNCPRTPPAPRSYYDDSARATG